MRKVLLLFLIALPLFCMGQAHIWHISKTISGCGTLQTDLIPIKGEKWKINYKSNGRIPFVVDMFDAKGVKIASLVKSNNKQPSQDSRTGTITSAMTNVFLRIQGSDNGWSMTFSLLVDDVDNWELSKNKKQIQQLAKYGMWTGEAGEIIKIPINLPSNHWKIKFVSFEQGRLKASVSDADGNSLINTYLFSPGESEAWIHQAGNFIIEAEAMATPWSIEIDFN